MVELMHRCNMYGTPFKTIRFKKHFCHWTWPMGRPGLGLSLCWPHWTTLAHAAPMCAHPDPNVTILADMLFEM